jgi:hypothetical protein
MEMTIRDKQEANAGVSPTLIQQTIGEVLRGNHNARLRQAFADSNAKDAEREARVQLELIVDQCYQEGIRNPAVIIQVILKEAGKRLAARGSGRESSSIMEDSLDFSDLDMMKKGGW